MTPADAPPALNLFGEPDDAPVERPAPVNPPKVKLLESWQYYTLLDAAEKLKTDPEHTYAILSFHNIPTVTPYQPEMWPCYGRAAVDAIVASRQGRKG